MNVFNGRRAKRLVLSLLATGLALAAGCTAVHSSPAADRIMPLGQTSFEQYVRETTDWIAKHRHFVTENPAEELAFQLPFEIRPAHPNGKGILLIHGFTDSPFNFRDLGEYFARHGYLVRAVVLPGHGTKPEDMLYARYEDWKRVVAEQTAILTKEVDEVYLAGFSTGGNLAIHEAYRNEAVDGLLLFSPAPAIRTSLVRLVPLVSLFTDWLKKPDEKTADVMPQRYRNAPLPALQAFAYSMDESYDDVASRPYDKPVLAFLAENDSIADTQKLLALFQKQFTSPDSRFIWYGTQLPESVNASDARITVRTDYLPREHIRSFSHLGLVFSPENPWYGRNGKNRFCLRGQSDENREKCHKGEDLWYGSWREDRDNHPYARLSFNPYFDWQAGVIVNVLNRL